MARLILKKDNEIVQEFPLDKDTLIIGRDKSCEISLEDSSVSRQHAKISKSEEKFIIEDLGSSNGTLLNGKKIEKQELKAKDEIAIGRYTLVFQQEEVAQDLDKTVVIPEAAEEVTRIVVDKKEGFPKLIILEGGKKGAEFSLKPQETIIGRANECHILLDDKKVSRHHAKINFQDGAYVILDLGSYNGIFVNGKKVEQKKLAERDIIEIGPFKLKIILSPQVAGLPLSKELLPRMLQFISKVSKNLPTPMKKPPVLIATGVLAVIILFTLVVSLITRTPSETAGPPTKSALLNQGIDFYKTRKYKEAVDKFQAALEIEPESEQIQNYLNKAQEAYYFTAGVEDFEAARWDAAVIKFTQVLAINPNQEKAKEYLEIAKVKAEASQHFSQGKQFSDRSAWKQAVEEFNAALRIQPDYLEAQKYLTETKDKMASAESFAQGKEKFETEKYIEAIAAFKKIPAQDDLFASAQEYIEKANRTVQNNEYIKKALDLYNNGNDQQALNWLDKIPQEERGARQIDKLMEKVRTVGSSYNRANELTSQGKVLEALAEWNKIVALETDPNNLFLRAASQQIEKMRPQLLKNEEEAKELFRAGYVLREVNPQKAIENWKKVLELLPPDNEYYLKAKKMLEKY